MKKVLLTALVSIFFLANPVLAQAATLSLSPSSGTINKGCSFGLDIILDTSGAQTDGTDAILIYDTSRLSATSIVSGTIYPDYPGNNIDETQGKVTVSGLSSVSEGYRGRGTLATVNFVVKENATSGVSQIKFDFDPNDKTKTTDSNVVERGTVVDILNSVTNGSYTVGTGSCTTQTVAAGGTGGAGSATSSGLIKSPKTIDDLVGGKTGSESLTFTIVIVGAVLTILGILGFALL